jgi:hypothetical protein
MPTGWIPPERPHPRAAGTPSTAVTSRRRDRRPVAVVLQIDRAGVYVAPVTLRRRLEAVLLADRLDHSLARGAVPETDVLLALRAERLASAHTRNELARSVGRLLRVAGEPQRGLTRVPAMAVLERVRESHDALEELVDHLLAPVPVSAHGVALVRLLLRDGSGPLFRYESRDDLTSQVRRAIAALDPGQGWPD